MKSFALIFHLFKRALFKAGCIIIYAYIHLENTVLQKLYMEIYVRKVGNCNIYIY